MKKVFSMMIAVTFLTSCAITGGVYDTNEYAAFVDVGHAIYAAKETCGDPTKMNSAAANITNATAYAVVFTKHQPYNDEMHKIAIEIDKMAKEFQAASHGSTKTYCDVKLNSLSLVAETAIKAAASKRRQ